MERLLDYFVPKKYILNLKIDKSEKTIGGEVVAFGEVKSETVKFHAVDLKINTVSINCEN